MKNMKNILPGVLFFASLYFFVQPVSAQQYGPEQKISAEQNFPSAVRPGSEFMVEIKIKKGNVTGLAKFQQYIPAGMTATALNNAGADFSVESQNVKFIWTSVPQNDITIRYKISVASTLLGKKYLSGTFSYVENDRTKKTSLVPKEIDITPTAPATEVPVAASAPVQEETQPAKTETASASQQVAQPETKSETATDNPPPAETTAPAVAETKKQEEPSAPPTAAEPPSTSTATPSSSDATGTAIAVPIPTSSASGVVFKVQIAAMNEKHFRRKNYFQEKFGLQLEVAAEEQDGLKKYTVGNFASYAEARKLRDEILSSAQGCFVVAYKDGARIPVSDAIDLAKKK